MADNKKNLFDALSKKYDLGTYEYFNKALNDESKRRKLYDAVQEDFDLGSYEYFSKKLGYGAESSAAEPPAAPKVATAPVVEQSAAPKVAEETPKPQEPTYSESLPKDWGEAMQKSLSEGIVKPDNYTPQGAVPVIEKGHEIIDGQDTITSFGPAFVQSSDQLYQGGKALVGEAANLVTGSTMDERKALASLSQRTDDTEQFANSDWFLKKWQNEFTGWDGKTDKEKKSLAVEYSRDHAKRLAELTRGLIGKQYETENGKVKTYNPRQAYKEAERLMSDERRIAEALKESRGDVHQAATDLSNKVANPTWGDELIDEVIAKNETYLPTKGVGAYLGNLAPQMIPNALAIGLGAMSGGAPGAVAAGMRVVGKGIGIAGMGALTASTAGSTMAEARKRGATSGEVWAAGLADAATEMVTEWIPFMSYTESVFAGSKARMAKQLAQVLETPQGEKEFAELLKRANKELGGKLFSKSNVEKYILDVTKEGLSEFSAEAIETITPMIYEHPENYPTLGEVIRNGLEGAKGGVTMGAILGGMSTAATYKQHDARRRANGEVSIGIVDRNGEQQVCEIIGKDRDGKLQVLVGNEVDTVDESQLSDMANYTYEEFKRAELQKYSLDGYDEGYNALDPLEKAQRTRAYEIRRKEAAEALGMTEEEVENFDPELLINPNSGFVQKQREVALQKGENPDAYVARQYDLLRQFRRTKFAYDGMIGKARDQIKEQTDAVRQQVQSRVNTDTGMIHPVTIANEDGTPGATAYIVGGNVAYTEDGRLDKTGSGDMLLVVDGNGENARPLTDVIVSEYLPVINPEQQIGEASAAIAENIATKAEAEMSGTVQYNVGDQYTLPDGTEGTISREDEDNIYVLTVNEKGETAEIAVSKTPAQELADAEIDAEAQEIVGAENAEDEEAEKIVSPEPVSDEDKTTAREIGGVDGMPFVHNGKEYSLWQVAGVYRGEDGRVMAQVMPYSEDGDLPELLHIPLDELREAFDDYNQPRDFMGEKLPLKDDGSVDEAVLFERNPEAWARWNDSERGDGGKNSATYLAAVAKRAQKSVEKLSEAYDEELDFGKRAEMDKELDGLRKRADKYSALVRMYDNRESELNEPQSLRQLIASALRTFARDPRWRGIDRKEFVRETGLKGRDAQKYFSIFRKGGSSVSALAEDIADTYGHLGFIPLYENGSYDVAVVRDELIDLLRSNTLSDIYHLTRDENVEFAQKNNLFSQTDGKIKKAEKADPSIALEAARLQGRYGDKLHFISSISEIKDAKLLKVIQLGTTRGWYNPNTGDAYIYLPDIADVKDLHSAVTHEVLIHQGLQKLMGKEKYAKYCQYVFDNLMTPAERAFFKEKYNGDISEVDAADEFLAHLGQSVDMTESEEKSFWGKALEKLRSLFGKDEIYDFDGDDSVLRSLLKASHARAIRDVNIAESYNAMKDFVARYNGDADKEKDEANVTKVVDSSEEMSKAVRAIEDTRANAMGRRLSPGESAILMDAFDAVADAIPEEVEYNKENFDRLFGAGVTTPLGAVKMSENQFKKFGDKNRKWQLALASETLKAPDFITKKPSQAKDGNTERPFSYVYGKTFVGKDGNGYTYYNSVSVAQDGLEVVMSNYDPNRTRLERELRDGNLAYIKEVTLPSESDTSTQGDQITEPIGAFSADKVTNSQEENNTVLSKIDNVDRAIASVTGRDVNEVYAERVRHELAKNQEFVNLVKAPSELAKEDFKYSKVNANQQIFVSNAQRAVESLNMGRASGDQWLKAIQGKGGLKAGEDKWLGLSEWLAEQKKPVTKEELLKYIDENRIRIEEVRYEQYGRIPDEAFKEDYVFGAYLGNNKVIDAILDETQYNAEERKYEWRARFKPDAQCEEALIGLNSKITDEPINLTRIKYTTEGLKNKREIALTVPTIEPWNQDDQIHFGDAGGGRAIAWIRFGDTDDGRILVIDEIQSKRHQEGREKGYKGDQLSKMEQDHAKAVEATEKYWDELVKKYGVDTPKAMTAEERERFDELTAKARSLFLATEEMRAKEKAAIPTAPFEKNWHELAMKRMLRLAAEEGYDKIAWTSGDMQSERYGLGGFVDNIAASEWIPVDGKTANPFNEEYKVLHLEREGDDTMEPLMHIYVNRDGKVIDAEHENGTDAAELIGKSLSEVVGKELTQKILASDTEEDFNGENLRIGGEGMRGFYDDILPRFVDKYGKKWGVKTHDLELPVGEGKWHSVDVTPEMKESVMEGQLMFSRVTDPDLIRRLDSEPVEEWYGSMTWLNPEETDKSKWKFAPVKSAKDSKGQLREASYIGQWEQSEEDLEGLKSGKYDLKDIDNDVVGGVNYNPYFHVSNSLMNDQFTGAYNKPNTVVVKFLVPKSELYPEGEAYHAEGAKNHVGVLPWHSGIINAKLPADKQRSVALTRWRKPVGIATDEEVAKFIAGKLKEANASMPWNLVTPGVLAELDKIGAPISEGAGSAKMKGVPRPGVKFSRYSSDMLREIASGISKEDYNKFAMDVFRTDENARRAIVGMASGKSWDFLGATKQFLASLAEDSESADKYRGIYDKARELYAKPLTNDEARYLLWRNGDREKGTFGAAEDIVMQKKLGVGDFADDGVKFSKVSDNHAAAKDLKSMPVPGYLKEGKINNSSYDQYALFTGLNPLRKLIAKEGFYKPYRDVFTKPDMNDYYIGTDVTFEPIASAADESVRSVDNKWRKMKERGGLEFHQSPLSSSEYLLDRENGIVYRYSDHWGRLATCNWDIDDPNLEGGKGLYIGKANIGDFKVNGVSGMYMADNPEVRKSYAEALEQTIANYEGVLEDPSLTITEGARKKFRQALDSFYKIRTNLEEGGYDAVRGKGVMFSKSVTNDDRLAVDIDEYTTRLQGFRDEAQYEKDEVKRSLNELKVLADSISDIRKAMNSQAEYDKRTADSVAGLANLLVRSHLLSDISSKEAASLISTVRKSVGKKDISASVDRLYAIVIDNQLRRMQDIFGKVISRKASKVDQSGVVVQGQLDIAGQQVMSVFKDNLDTDVATIEEKMESAMDRMSSDNKSVSEQASLEYVALTYAKEYRENIAASRDEEKSLRTSIKEKEAQKADGSITGKQFISSVRAIEAGILENRAERVKSYMDLSDQLIQMQDKSHDAAIEFAEKNRQRINEIRHNANSDLEGLPDDEQAKLPSTGMKVLHNPLFKLLLSPVATFDQMLRAFGSKSANGEGYLWNRFMRGWVKATDDEYVGFRDATRIMDEKASVVFGRKMLWSDLYSIDKRLPKVEVRMFDGSKMEWKEITQGQALYLYMVNKMVDGRMKLRNMGIEQSDIDELQRNLDPRFVELADWLQSQFLPSMWEKYNEVHKRMFGASMSSIDNYFPLKILATAREEKIDLNDSNNTDQKPSTITGAVIKRVRNNTALDVMNSNAFSVAVAHIQEMEHWAAFAEWNRDLSDLLSYKKFRNRLKNMDTVYGAAGTSETTWSAFKKVAQIASGVYRVNTSDIDKFALRLAKGVTAAKIALRVFTALKQFLSFPAYLPEANPVDLVKGVAAPWKSWNWCIKNLPMFEKRWKSRQAGDHILRLSDNWKSELVENAARVGMSPNAFVDALTVSVGAKAMYDTRRARYIKDGYSAAEAHTKAVQDAEILYNETQQSNESAFLSAVQSDRTVTSAAFTVFRNSSMGYGRQEWDAMRNLAHRFRKGYKDNSITFMTKQFERDGLDAADASSAARRLYRRQGYRDLARIATFGFLMQFAWNLGAYLPYLLFGDDDKEKDKMLEDAAMHGLVGGSFEGLAGGGTMSEMINMRVHGEKPVNNDFALLPIVSDFKNLVSKFGQDRVQGYNELVNLLVQVGVGVNPQTIEDTIVAVMDACNGNMTTAKEAMFLAMRILQIPQSQLDKLYLDEIGMEGKDARKLTVPELAERYADYKLHRNTFSTRWMYDELERRHAEEKLIKRFEKKAKGRLAVDEIDSELGDIKEMSNTMEEDIRQLKEDKENGYEVAGEMLRRKYASPEYETLKSFAADYETLVDLARQTLEEVDEQKAEQLQNRLDSLKVDMIDKYSKETESDPERDGRRAVYLEYLDEYDGVRESLSDIEKRRKSGEITADESILAISDIGRTEEGRRYSKYGQTVRDIRKVERKLKNAGESEREAMKADLEAMKNILIDSLTANR